MLLRAFLVLVPFKMFATPSGRRPGSTRRLFGQRNDTAGLDDDQESPVPTDEAGRVDTAPTNEESGEMLCILRNLQQQVSSLQAQQTAQAAAPSVAESPAASTSSNSTSSSPVEKKLPKDLTVRFTITVF